MRLDSLYRAEFTYPEAWAIDLEGAAGTEGQHFFIAEGRCAYPEGRRQIVGSATHLADDERYRWLNDVVCVCTGEVRLRPDESGADLVLEVAELLWEPMAA